ncbi:uncharacterized protein GGS22DRAFT_116106 [Annulohypoxylon maeteangense]|uniref:uncharacterized protein n=1 Tax=Annulohypoxylon maeteangense TaxID=1927788 RepID=UPI00200879FF|nr:uncharacterized protein GGS22DRAFT_116106 [Annulohypoxylon maeteangense]KAI0886656.1 hypothetical protein GGS22DRAFT_116106 [Annulohypoxylon maeteangense]
MGDQQDLPIALRRTPRLSVGRSVSSELSRLETAATSLRTPSKPRSKKRVRFSDPGPEIEHHDAASTTGLTPMVRRTTLSATPSSKRRRRSEPMSRKTYPGSEMGEQSHNNNGNGSNEIRFLSLRQVLDDRVKRRIRRNGLSEEMNTITQEKRRRTQDQKTELERLQQELAEKDHEIERLQNTTVAQDTERIMELEYEIDSLRNELRRKSVPEPNPDQTQRYDWTMAARDPFSDSYMDDDDGFGDTTMADLVCSTPSKNNRASASFPTPPCTSPTIPFTPSSTRRDDPVTPQFHSGPGMQTDMGVQTSFIFPSPDEQEEKQALEAELGSLRLELTKLTEVLETHEALKSRLAEKLTCAQPPSSSSSTPVEAGSMDVEAHLDTVLQSLSDRTAALLDLNTSLSALGFPGSDAGEMIVALTSAFRSARLELEYLTPGELTLPLSAHGAQILDLVLVRLRELAKQVREDEDAIDEYHALELSLRQQLGARVDAMDSMRLKREEDVRERDARIEELEVGVERMKGAAEGYRREVKELEGLVVRMEEEGKSEATRLSAELAGARAEVDCERAGARKLEARLVGVREQAEAFRIQLVELQQRRTCEVKALNKYHGAALAVRDARVLELRRDIESMGRSLHEAHLMVQRLRVENLGLSDRVDEERNRATAAVDSMKAELERVLRMSAEFLATPVKASGSSRSGSGRRSVAVGCSVGVDAASGGSGEEVEAEPESETTTPEGSPLSSGSYLAGALAKSAKGKKKRKYDSGLGLLDEDEDGSVDLV